MICIAFRFQETRSYFSTDEISTKDCEDSDVVYPLEQAHSTSMPGSIPEHQLDLVIGQPVMLMRNFDGKRGAYNGVRYVVVNMYKHNIELCALTGPAAGQTLFLPRITLSPDKTCLLPYDLKRRQFPIMPSWACTIHKSQGQTFSISGVHLESEVFTHGQLYVALSRSEDPQNICVYSTTDTMLNIVYPELLVQ